MKISDALLASLLILLILGGLIGALYHKQQDFQRRSLCQATAAPYQARVFDDVCFQLQEDGSWKPLPTQETK